MNIMSRKSAMNISTARSFRMNITSKKSALHISTNTTMVTNIITNMKVEQERSC